MEENTQKKPRKPRMRRSREFLAMCRGQRNKLWVARPDAPTVAETPPVTVAPTEKHFRHSMTRDKRTNEWRVRVPSPKGRTRYVTTGETDAKEALKVVDKSGVQQLSVLARARCVTQNTVAIVLAGHDKTCADVARTWMRDLVLDLSKNTCDIYSEVVDRLFKANDCASKPPSFITREMLHAFVNDPALKHSTRSSRLAAVCSFYRHASGFGHVIGNIASTVKVNLSSMTIAQREREPAVSITEAEYRLIMADPLLPRFWQIATALGYWLGLRMVDVCKLERATIAGEFAVLYPHKTGRRLVIPIHDPMIGSGELRDVFQEILGDVPEGQTLCFPRESKRYDQGRASMSVEYGHHLKGVGVKGKSFHSLRHSFKARLMASGKTLEEVSKLMGHADTRTTEGYGRTTAPSTAQPSSAEVALRSVPVPPASGDSDTAQSQTA